MILKEIKLTLSSFLLIGLTAIPLLAQPGGDSSKVTLAVMDFKNNSAVFGYDRLERTIPELLKTELSRSAEIVVVERSKIESILREQALAQAGVIENEAAQKVGQLAGAEYIITGEINTIGSQLRIDAHLLKIATGQVSGEKITSRTAENIEPMVKLLAENLIFNLTGKGERKEVAKIKRYQPTWALAATAALAVASAMLHFNYKNKYDSYHKTDQFDKFDSYYNSANRYYKARNVMLMLSGVAALTSFTLWRKDQAEENKIHASNYHLQPDDVRLAIAVRAGDYWVSVGFSF